MKENEIRPINIRHLYISPGHNFRGHHGLEPGVHPILEMDRVDCVAGKGLVGDRYFGHEDNFKGQITFFALEVHRTLCAELDRPGIAPSVYRRNVLTEGLDLGSLVGREFELQGVRFFGTEECRPCYWMDRAVGPGAEAAMQGRGGLRARILTNGCLRQTVSYQSATAGPTAGDFRTKIESGRT
jgi:MOSC domain-containing protein YiiM